MEEDDRRGGAHGTPVGDGPSFTPVRGRTAAEAGTPTSLRKSAYPGRRFRPAAAPGRDRTDVGAAADRKWVERPSDLGAGEAFHGPQQG